MTRAARRAATFVAIAILALSPAACGGSAAGNEGGAPVSTTQVDLPKSYRFAPAAIVVTAGATVTWTNSDNFTHSVTFDGEPSPGAVIAPGASTSRTFAESGTFHYVCTFHPQDMEGSVEVTAALGSEQP